MDGIRLYTRNIYLLGSAEKGPVNYPVHITSLTQAKRIFGSIGSLIDGISQVIDMNVSCNLWVVKSTGRHAEAKLNVLLESGDIIKQGFVLRSRHADDYCNDIEVFLDENFLSFKLKGYNNLEATYDLSKYITVKDLADAINDDTRNMKNEIVCVVNCPYDTLLEYALTTVNESSFKLSGGDSGLLYNKNEMFFSLMNTYSTLEGQFVDIVIPLCAYYDDTFTDDINNLDIIEENKDYLSIKDPMTNKYDSFYKQLLSFCVLQMKHGFITHGILDTTPRAKYKLNENNLGDYLKKINDINKLDDDMSKYNMMVSVCGTDLWDNYGTHITSGSIPYACLLASTDVTQSTTNKTLTDKFLVVDKYSDNALKTFSAHGFVSYRYSPLHHLATVFHGVTKCETSNFRYVANVRTFQVVAKHFRTFLYKYIGSNIEDLVISGHMESEISQMLDELVAMKLIHSISGVSVTIDDYKHVSLDLDIISIHNLEEIKMSNSVCINNGGV